ncbi:MAG TPA: Ig-like domain-containing protein [Nocardioidaceae bacterium]|nr:Ig-like domain-containing protein [Nocardioidaceae bacterium]
MSVRQPVLRGRRRAAGTAGLLVLALTAAGCSSAVGGTAPDLIATPSGTPSAPTSSAAPQPAATVRTNLPDTGTVHVDKVVKLHAEHGRFKSVDVSAKGGLKGTTYKGTLSKDKQTWTSTSSLEPGEHVSIKAVAVDKRGLKTKRDIAFRADPLTLDQQTYPSIAPLPNETVGIGMPVIVHFDVAVTDKANIEKHLHVTNTSGQVGAWHWISDNEVRWRPKHYWKPGTDVTVSADVNSVDAGNGIYGQLDNTTTFHIGDAMIDKVNLQTDQMKVYRNGTLLRTIPVSAGKPGFTTRSGIKVIIEKFRHVRMDAATIGISKSSPEYYDLSHVGWAMRLTYSGEFLHAAPWSAAAQGVSNTSHGCTGMSTANAKWLFGISKRGDVVVTTGSDRPMTLTNGYGDWNESFAQYKQGSALN